MATDVRLQNSRHIELEFGVWLFLGGGEARVTQNNGLVADAVVARETHPMIVLVVEQFDRDAARICLAGAAVRAAVGTEGALADLEIVGVSDDGEFDRSHRLLLAPARAAVADVRGCTR